MKTVIPAMSCGAQAFPVLQGKRLQAEGPGVYVQAGAEELLVGLANLVLLAQGKNTEDKAPSGMILQWFAPTSLKSSTMVEPHESCVALLPWHESVGDWSTEHENSPNHCQNCIMLPRVTV